MARVRVLLVEDDEDDFRIARDLLAEIKDGEFELDWVRSFENAVAAIARGGYDAALVDYFLGRRSGLDLLCGALKRGTLMPVILVTGHDMPQLGIEAKKHGAAGFLLKRDLTAQTLSDALCAGIANHMPITNTDDAPAPPASWPPVSRLGRLFAVIGAKGGMGTSTIVANVAAAFVRRRLVTTVIEMRGYPGNLARMFNVIAYSTVSNLLRATPDEIDDVRFEGALTLHPSGIRVLSAPHSAADFCEIGAEHVEAILDAATRTSDIVIVDLPCDASASNRQVLSSADAVAMVIERDPLAVASATSMLSMLYAWQVSAPVGSVIVSRAAVAESIGPADINSQLGLKKYGVIPAAGELFYKSSVTLTPLVAEHPAHPAGRALAEIATVMMMEPKSRWRAMLKDADAAANHQQAPAEALPIETPPSDRFIAEWPRDVRTI
jgi:Flp pilus assembly CpaE family ATPase